MTTRMSRLLLVATVCGGALLKTTPSHAAERLPAPKLIELAAKDPNAADFRDSLVLSLGQDRIKNGTAFSGEGPDFIWAVEATSEPKLVVDDDTGPAMTHIEGTNVWFASGKLRTGKPHEFHYLVEGKEFGGSADVPAFGPDSYPHDGVPQGKMSEMLTHISKIYDGMESRYWVYVPAQYDANKPAGLMVWTDGGGHLNRNGGDRAPTVIDNLTAQGKIPVMIHIFTSPGDIQRSPGTPTFDYVTAFSKKTGRTMPDAMRSTEYDTVSDRYVRFLREELVPEVGKQYHIRQDGYSHAIMGGSSGAIAAFNAAWQQPEYFSRVLSHIGTYTSIQWQPGALDGGNIFPFAIRKTPRKNIRVWLSDGSNDLENEHGSWPLQNIQMANSLKMAGYDFHFSFGPGTHNGAHGAAELPESLVWLWRDYDSNKTEQAFEQEPAERSKPYYRVRIVNRD